MTTVMGRDSRDRKKTVTIWSRIKGWLSRAMG